MVRPRSGTGQIHRDLPPPPNPKYETRVRWHKILGKLVLRVVWSKYSDSNIKGHISTKKYLDVRFNTKIGSWSLHSSTKMYNSRFYRQSDLHVRSEKILLIWKIIFAILKVTLPHKIYLDVGILSTFLVACESRVFSLMKKCYVSFTRILVSFNKQINSS